MVTPAVWVPNDPVPLVRLPDVPETLGNPALRRVWDEATAGAYVPDLLWRLSGRPRGEPVDGVRDDNRSAILPGRRVILDDREYVATVKGCGAATDAFQHAPLSAARLRSICRDPSLLQALAAEDGSEIGFITGERWFGNVPYGGQAPDNGVIGLLASLRAQGTDLAGFRICPIVALVRLPDACARIASSFYWYRRYAGAYWQELRLMPSNVRVYFHSPVTFGMDTPEAFALFGLSSLEACERFLENLARSALAALTLYARTLRFDDRAGRYLGLAYHDVWLDKDAVIAADGTMHFVDLEGIEDVSAETPAEVRETILHQFHRHVYEASYALEAMAAETHRRFRVEGDPGARRRWVLEILERAAGGDPCIRIERSRGRVVAHVAPRADADACSVEIEVASGEVA